MVPLQGLQFLPVEVGLKQLLPGGGEESLWAFYDESAAYRSTARYITIGLVVTAILGVCAASVVNAVQQSLAAKAAARAADEEEEVGMVSGAKKKPKRTPKRGAPRGEFD